MISETLKKIELEITNGCNAACPGCARTQHLEKIKPSKITLDDLKEFFPTFEHINGKKFKFCGVLGDPAFHPECIDMVEYLATHGGWCQLSTNGAIQSADWWYRLGDLSRRTKNVDVSFCIDGHKETNHIYRVNTVWSVLERNIQAYTDGGQGKAQATWIFIVFDHNEHELETAREHAEKLGIKFATRTGMRNSYYDWVSYIGKKNNKTEKIITTTGSKEHSKKIVVQEIDNFIKDYKQNKVSDDKKQEMLDSIVCKYIHESEIFIGSDKTMWPCCFLYDNAFKNREEIVDKLNIFEPNWNNLKHHSIEQIQEHPWFKKLLAASWDPGHPLHFSRCIKTCAKNKAYHNEIIYADN